MKPKCIELFLQLRFWILVNSFYLWNYLEKKLALRNGTVAFRQSFFLSCAKIIFLKSWDSSWLYWWFDRSKFRSTWLCLVVFILDGKKKWGILLRKKNSQILGTLCEQVIELYEKNNFQRRRVFCSILGVLTYKLLGSFYISFCRRVAMPFSCLLLFRLFTEFLGIQHLDSRRCLRLSELHSSFLWMGRLWGHKMG